MKGVKEGRKARHETMGREGRRRTRGREGKNAGKEGREGKKRYMREGWRDGNRMREEMEVMEGGK